MKPESTPWRAMLKLAASFGLSPPSFWRLSLTEWRALVAPAQRDVLSRASFESMAQQFPDSKA